MNIQSLILLEIFLLSLFFYFIIFNYKKKISLFLGTIDYPKDKRKIHKIPTPKTASYSVAVTLMIILINNFIFNFLSKDFNTIIISSLIVFVVGLVDDKFNLNAYKKLFLISLIVIISIIISPDILITKFYSDTFDAYIYLEKFSLAFTILCILLLINSFNLIDGINGLALSVLITWFIYFIYIFHADLNIHFYIILFILILSFFHNYFGLHFLGDSGSLMLSYFFGFLTIKLMNLDIENPKYLISCELFFLMFMIPGVDMFRLFLERIFRKKDPFIADNNHFHHILIKKHSLKKTLFIYLFLINFPIILFLYYKINALVLISLSIFVYAIILFIYKKINLKI